MTWLFWTLHLCQQHHIPSSTGFISLGSGYRMWYTWPPSSHTVAPLVTMPATWITKALYRQGMENNDGHDSKMEKQVSPGRSVRKHTKRNIKNGCWHMRTPTETHASRWIYIIGQWNSLQIQLPFDCPTTHLDSLHPSQHFPSHYAF